jgi:hypothetical protein
MSATDATTSMLDRASEVPHEAYQSAALLIAEAV